MNVCAKCGFENNANVKNCTNCVTDLHWAKVNLGKFDGNTDDTRRIGIESRKARGLLAPEDESKPLEPIHLLDTDPIRSTIGSKNIGLSILTGIGHAIVGFFAGATLSASLIFMFMITSGYFSETGPDMVIYISPLIGVLTAIIVGIRGGIKTYNGDV